MKKDEKGYIVVETLGTFIPFVLLMVAIMSLVNIVVVQSRIHYAMTQAATTLSMYCYALEVTGVADDLQALSSGAGTASENINTITEDVGKVLDGLDTISADNIGSTGDAAGRVIDAGGDIIQNPKQILQLVLNEGVEALFENLVRPIVGRYLSNGSQSGDEYLKGFGVIGGLDGLNFSALDTSSSSTLITADGDVKLVVDYEIDYKFGALPLPELKIKQTVVTKAWLGGSGEGYK